MKNILILYMCKFNKRSNFHFDLSGIPSCITFLTVSLLATFLSPLIRVESVVSHLFHHSFYERNILGMTMMISIQVTNSHVQHLIRYLHSCEELSNSNWNNPVYFVFVLIFLYFACYPQNYISLLPNSILSFSLF